MTNLEVNRVSTATVGSSDLGTNWSFNAAVSSGNGCALVDLDGGLVLGKATTAIRNLSDELHRADIQCVVLDMSKISHIDSAGLGELISLATALIGSGGALFGVMPRRYFLQRLLAETRFINLIRSFEWREPALRAAERWVLENSGW